MNGKVVASFGLAVLALSLSMSEPSYAKRNGACESAGLNGRLLGLCTAYTSGHSCLEPEYHGSRRCAIIRQQFWERSGGVDLDELLSTDSTRVVIPVTGGSVTLPDIGTITFPADAFDNDTPVLVSAGADAEVGATFAETTAIFRTSSRLAYEVTVATGSLPPKSDTIDVRLNLPADFNAQVPAGYGIELFALVEQSSDLESGHKSFELFESFLSSDGNAIEASIPGAAFFLDASGEYTAVFTLAPTPGTKDPLSVLRK